MFIVLAQKSSIFSLNLENADSLHAYGQFPPTEECGVLPRGEADDKK